MDLSTLKPAKGSVKNQGKRVGRGQGSGAAEFSAPTASMTNTAPGGR